VNFTPDEANSFSLIVNEALEIALYPSFIGCVRKDVRLLTEQSSIR
jgi:hypothetical protein